MKIGFYMKWDKGSISNSKSIVYGDELYVETMRKTLMSFKEIEFTELYAPNFLPDRELDFMIYINDTPPQKTWAKKHLLYFQNPYKKGSLNVLKELQKYRFDGYAFISSNLLKLHKNCGMCGIYLPFGVDTDFFYPRESEKKYEFEVAFVGNDFKGIKKNTKYLLPAANFKLGLFGKWGESCRFSLFGQETNLFTELKSHYYYLTRSKPIVENDVSILYKICRGKIPQEKVPILYSSSKININFAAQDNIDWDVITLRTLEVMACKGFLISDKTESTFRKLKKCIVFSDGGLDLFDKIKYYLAHSEERKEIASAGYEYVIKNASIQSRMQSLINYLKEIK